MKTILNYSYFLIVMLCLNVKSGQSKTVALYSFPSFLSNQDTIPPNGKIEYDTTTYIDPKTYKEVQEIMTKEETAIRNQQVEMHYKMDMILTFDPKTNKEDLVGIFKEGDTLITVYSKLPRNLIIQDTIYSFDPAYRKLYIWYRGIKAFNNTDTRVPIDTIITFHPETYEKQYRYIYADENPAKKIKLVDSYEPIQKFKDHRDGQTYRSRLMKDGKTWMIDNLNFNAKGSSCPYKSTEQCKEYGRFYNNESLLLACPKGWRLPSDEDWSTLLRSSPKGTKIKEYPNFYRGGISFPANQVPHISLSFEGAEIFNIQLAGYVHLDGRFREQGTVGIYAIEPDQNLDKKVKPMAYFTTKTDLVRDRISGKIAPAFSCRCIQDN